MKKFKAFLLEAIVTPDEAKKIFGLTSSYTEDELKKKYRELSIKYHPDKAGGSLEMMQKINVAYDILKKTKFSNSARYDDLEKTRESNIAKLKIYQNYVREKIDSTFKPSAFISYFEKLFSESSFKFEHTKKDDTSYVTGTIRFFNIDRSISLEFYYYSDLISILNAKSLTLDDSIINLSIDTKILYNNKQVKLTKNVWNFKKDQSVLVDPKITFPENKLISKTKASVNKKFGKQDAFLILTRRLEASNSKEWFRIPLIPEYTLTLARMTYAGTGRYVINGIYFKGVARVFAPNNNVTIEETEDSMNMLVELVLDMRKSKDKEELQKKLTVFIDKYKSFRGSR